MRLMKKPFQEKKGTTAVGGPLRSSVLATDLISTDLKNPSKSFAVLRCLEFQGLLMLKAFLWGL